MSQRRRPTAAAVLLLLLAAVFAPSLCGVAPSVHATAGTSALSAASAHSPAPAAAPGTRPDARPRAEADGTGGTCRQQDVPLKGAEVAVAAAHADPVTGPGTTRVTLPQAEVPRPGTPRAPPVPVAGCAELLPVLRI
ncbi:hypothetical protein [Streptomyces griseocarneus]|uniref:hypothetical protein n=1 Tax=Streptomyces griseocarneus TaxID=51201 RepID=UPI00167DC2F1|nr:hypothetical protein [Streptomyces griseocarneus]MBZ6477032.1 hypothetical protein [Streptomyces griseocarneus]GHG70063.1 hypothetical protein GCM10018779_43860 [Streptomyces griseocarneus]